MEFKAGQKFSIIMKDFRFKGNTGYREQTLTIDSQEGDYFFISLSGGGSGLGVHKSVMHQVLLVDNRGILIE